MLYAFETTLRPNYLDNLSSPETNDENFADQSNTENKKELDCKRVMNKCYGELIFIFLYIAVLFFLFVSLTYQINFGKIYTVLIEFAFCLILDQVKSFIT